MELCQHCQGAKRKLLKKVLSLLSEGFDGGGKKKRVMSNFTKCHEREAKESSEQKCRIDELLMEYPDKNKKKALIFSFLIPREGSKA